MFWNWFKKGKRLGVYSPAKRLIYTYFDGQKHVKADPMVLWKRVMDRGKDLEVDIQVANSTLLKPEESSQGEGRALEKIREIFNVKDFANGGLTEGEQAALFDDFMDFCATLKKNSRQSATSSSSQVSPSRLAKSTMKPSSASGSTADAEPTAKPASSASASALP